MSPSTVTCGPDLPNILWEARPSGSSEAVWRYSHNPIISRHAIPNANQVDGVTGRIAIDYGAADTVTGLAFGYVDEIVAFLKDNSVI